MPNLNPPLLQTRGLPPELDKYLREVRDAVNPALVKGDTYQVFQPYTATKPLVVPGTGFPNRYPYAGVATASGQSIPNNTNTVVNMDIVSTDTDGAVTTGAAWKFTVPAGKGGLYLVSVGVSLNATVAGACDQILGLFKNGAELVRLQRLPGNTTKETGLSGSIVLSLAAGDTVAPLIFQNSGAAVTLEANALANWLTVTGVNLSKPAVPSCFPFDVPWTAPAAPALVVAQVQDVANAATPANLALCGVDWIPVNPKGAVTSAPSLLRIRNIPNLQPGSYAVQVVTLF